MPKGQTTVAPTPTPRASAIPVGTQFAPSLLSLRNFVKAFIAHSGDPAAIKDAVWKPAVRVKAKAKSPTKRTRSLPVEAAIQYQLLDKDYKATVLAQDLAATKTDDHLYELFARHILLNCGGLRVLEGITQMEADNLRITGDSLARFLTEQGFNVTEHNTAINSLRMWLEKAGVLDGWKIDHVRREEVVPLSDEQIAILASFRPPLQGFVRALCRAEPSGWTNAATIRDAAEAHDHIKIGRMSLPNEVLKPLKAAGLVEYKSGGTVGGKSAQVRTTPKFEADVLNAFMANTIKDLDAAVSDYYRRRPADIFAELDATDTFVKGRALEAFAIMVMRQMGLRFVGWNKRAPDSTAQAEVDVVLSGTIGAVHTRWQLQCKNTPSTKLDTRGVASEVGLIPVTQATHILIISRGGFTDEAVYYAREIMKKTAISIYMLGPTDYATIQKDTAKLLTILRLQSQFIGQLQPSTTLFGGL
ncbi:MAG: restriction endonuclease [Gemmatimonadaceae bacterium]